MKKILVIGGSRFFGSFLVQNLIDKGHDVTVLNRGSRELNFKGSFKSLVCDRNDYSKMTKLIGDQTWDIIYDQVCYNYNEAKAACEFFNGKVNKYIFTSSKSVYPPQEHIKESDFDPRTYEFDELALDGTDEQYAEAKRQAEVAFIKYAQFPVTMVRFPIVYGENDYTGRFKFHVDRVKNSEPIYFPSIESEMTFVEAKEAAQALEFLGNSDYVGPINVASPDSLSLKEFIEMIETLSNSKANLLLEKNEEHHSPYGIESSWFMNCDLLKEIGLELSPAREKLRAEIAKLL